MTTQSTKSVASPAGGDLPSGPPAEVVDRLAGLLPSEALEEALEGLEPEQIIGPGGLLTRLAGRVIETALGAELSDHLGYLVAAMPRTPYGSPGRVRCDDRARVLPQAVRGRRRPRRRRPRAPRRCQCHVAQAARRLSSESRRRGLRRSRRSLRL
jgi:hypothetical protein